MDTLKVLVVDDEAGMRMGVQRALKDYIIRLPEVSSEVNFEVDAAENGAEALRKIAVQKYDLLLLDHMLPDMTGLDILTKLDERDGRMLTIMITAYASLETAVTAIKRGAYDFLAKPFTPAELKNTIRKGAETIIVARQARKLAQEKRQVRFQFISVLAHELKSPLNAIDGYMNILKEQSDSIDLNVQKSMLERSHVRIEQMRKLIVDLLDITRLESGQRKREFAEIDLQEAARAAIDGASPSAQERNIAISLNTTTPVKMNADRTEIEMIMNNLVSNAVKYNRDGGKVDILLEDKGDDISISVSDTGIGMSKEELSKLFGEFTRIRNPKTKNILGSGLGLSIVKKIAVMYEGDIEVTSMPDAGSTFTVILKKNIVPAEAQQNR